jgi:hypothetical protein
MTNYKGKIASVIKTATGLHVSIGDEELQHALDRHFFIPKLKLLEIIEQVLIDSTEIFLEKKQTLLRSNFIFFTA